MDNTIYDFFRHTDPILARLVEQYGSYVKLPEKRSHEHFVAELCETIVSQQLSVKAAATIWSRAKLLADDWSNPRAILEIKDELLRSAGLSGQKVSYVKNIAAGALDGTLNPESYSLITEADIINELTQIKGIGVWTAEMFLIFTLGKTDVFSISDLGLRNAITKHYGDLSRAEIQTLSETWSPYRSYASLVLWKSLDNEPKKS